MLSQMMHRFEKILRRCLSPTMDDGKTILLAVWGCVAVLIIIHAGVGEYQQAFSRVFGRPASGPDLLRAIASYERTLVSFNSPFDRFSAGDKNAIDDAAKRGWDLFNTRARCNKCHALTETQRDVTFFMDNDFHNIGIGIIRHNVSALARQADQLIKSGDTAAIDRAAI